MIRRLLRLAAPLLLALPAAAGAQTIVYETGIGLGLGFGPNGCVPTGPVTMCGGSSAYGSNAAPITIMTQQGSGPSANGGNLIVNLGNAGAGGVPGSVTLSGQQPELKFVGTLPNMGGWNVREQQTLNGLQIENSTGTMLVNLTATGISLSTSGVTRWSVDNNGNLTAGGTVATGGYTVGTLPTGTAGQRAYVTDQLTACPATGGALTGGGSVVCPVFRNATVWVGG